MIAALTRDLGAFAARTSFAALPATVAEITKRAFADTVGVTIGARHERAPQILLETIAPVPGPSSVLFGGQRARTADAAFLNAAAAHSIEMDDVALRGHPSAVLVPAIIAEAERLGAGGKAMIAAYAVGFELWGELVERERGMPHLKGWDSIGWYGPIAAAAASASLRRLSAEQAAASLAIAASQSSGLMANLGAMTKALHAAHAAHAGILSAALAEKGFSGGADALEGDPGFLLALSPSGDVDRQSAPKLGGEWRIERGLTVRRFPLSSVASRLADAALLIAAKNSPPVADIAEIRVRMSAASRGVLRYTNPQTTAEARFSVEFTVAAGLLAGEITLEQQTDGFLQSDALRALMLRVVVDLEPSGGVTAPVEVSVIMRRGDIISSGLVETALGTPAAPLSDAQLAAKFHNCVRYSARDDAEASRLGALFDVFMKLERVNDAREVMFADA